jgi:hypothetical protein
LNSKPAAWWSTSKSASMRSPSEPTGATETRVLM